MCIFSRAITYGRRRVGTSPLWVRGSRLSGEHVWESAHAPCHVTSSPKASSPWTARGYPTKDQGRIDAEAPLVLGDENENYTGVVSTGNRAATHAAGEVFAL